MECGKPFLILIKLRSIMWPITKGKSLEAILQGFSFGGALSTALEPSNRLQHCDTEFQCFP